ncbi:uncharacterized protein RJT21DRAFT_118453 [Scheffersomyces amazonensis]|uniref:uncharacterized protein n=1 Tax=Scheffersomyces amazonensis TaxID=1078765 RepID=UPI00315D76AD
MLKSVASKIIAFIFIFGQLTNALHFYLNTGNTRCFFEELPEDTLVVGRIDAYENPNLDHLSPDDVFVHNPLLRVQITVDETFDNNHRVVNQKSSPNGEFTFTSLDSGEHKFCLTPVYDDGSRGKNHRIFFDVAIGSAHDYVDSKSTKKIDSLTLKIQSLNKKLQEIHWEQEHMREREAIFRDQSENTNSRVIKWTIVQLIVLVGTCIYQLRHLKSFFVKQKIV